MRACVVFAGAVGGWVGPWAPPATPVARLATTVRMSDAENPFDWAPEAATPESPPAADLARQLEAIRNDLKAALAV